MIFQYVENKIHEEIMRNCIINPLNSCWLDKFYTRCNEKKRLERSKIGGVGTRVKIDECLFWGSRKYHRGIFLLGYLDIENNNVLLQGETIMGKQRTNLGHLEWLNKIQYKWYFLCRKKRCSNINYNYKS